MRNIAITKHLIVKTHHKQAQRIYYIYLRSSLQQYILIDTKSDRTLHCTKANLIVEENMHCTLNLNVKKQEF